MKKYLSGLSLIIVILLLLQLTVVGQDDEEPSCDLDDLQATIEVETADLLEDDPNIADEFSPEYVYRLSEIYADYALACGYQPTFPEIEAQIERTLDLAPLSFIIAASSIGNDINVALAELENVDGDSFNGQLLYNGLEMGLDGAELGCAGCHNGEAAPLVEGTYTRVVEERLTLPEFEDYSAEQYLVESILHPTTYIIPEYDSVQMPANYGGRLDAQQLADLIEYLSSQDQVSDSADESQNTETSVCDTTSTLGCDSVLATVEGDPIRGDGLYNGRELAEDGVIFGCAGCHTGGVIGPPTAGTWTRVVEERLTLPEFQDYSPERYLIEAIILPNIHIIEGYTANVMPNTYGEQTSIQDLVDIIAFLRETTQE